MTFEGRDVYLQQYILVSFLQIVLLFEHLLKRDDYNVLLRCNINYKE